MITAAQRIILKEYLIRQGLTFKPLLEEIVDHVACDLEERMQGGQSFEQALDKFIDTLPEYHFVNIQRETMETINKRFTLSRGFSFVAIGLFVISTTFKLMHYPWSTELLLLSFGFIAAALLVSSISGIYEYSEKKGAMRILAVVAGVILLLIAYSFKMLHLPGADQIIVLGVSVTIISFFINTIFVYRHGTGEGNLLTFLHEKYTPGIERFLLILLIPMTLYKTILIFSGTNEFIGGIFLVVAISGAGLQFVALNWRQMEGDLRKRTPYFAALLTIAFICLTLPHLGNLLPYTVRLIIISVFSIVAGWLTYIMEDQRNARTLLIVCLLPIPFLAKALLQLGLIPSSASAMFFNIPVMLVLFAALFLAKRHSILRTYVIMSLASYVLEFPSGF